MLWRRGEKGVRVSGGVGQGSPSLPLYNLSILSFVWKQQLAGAAAGAACVLSFDITMYFEVARREQTEEREGRMCRGAHGMDGRSRMTANPLSFETEHVGF